MTFLPILQSAFGVIYFVSWSATFWPQVILNFKRKNTGGFSSDFMAINIVGFVSYCLYTFCSFSIPAVKESYKKNIGFEPQVEPADVLFASHGAIMCTVLIIQMLVFPPRKLPKWYVTVGCVAFQSAVIVGLFLCLGNRLDWYKFLLAVGNVKVLSTLIKHFPQAYLNWIRGSTVGWSFTMVLLDVIGGSFSMAQQVVRCLRQGNLAPFTANWAKTILAAESLLFDYFFIAQHMLWYTDRTDIDATKDKGETELSGQERASLIL